MPDEKRITVYLDEDLVLELENIAKREVSSLSQVARRMIHIGIKESKGAKP